MGKRETIGDEKKKASLTDYLLTYMSSLFFADHVASEVDFSKALERLGESSMERMEEPDEIGAAFKNFAVVTKEMANLMKNMVSGHSQIASQK